MSSATKRVGVFVGALVLAVAVGSLAAGVGGQSSAPSVSEANASAFNTGDAVAEIPDESGEIEMSETAEGKVVVIDTTRSSSVTPETVTPMANALTENGATVRYTSGGSSFGAGAGGGLNSSLSGADAYIVFGASQPFTEANAAGLRAFTDAGGRVVLMNEPGAQPSFGAFGPSRRGGFGAPPNPLLPVTSEYGLSYENGYLYNMQDNANNYRNVYATPSGDAALTEGVDRVVLHESVAVSGGETLLTATDGTTLSTTRQSETYGVLTRSGNLVAVGDASVFDQEYVYHADNEVLVGNLLDFLVSGQKSPEDAPGSSRGGGGGFGGGGDTAPERPPTTSTPPERPPTTATPPEP